MNHDRQKRLLERLVKKIIKSKDFGSDCVLTSDESTILHTLLTETAVKMSKVKNT